MSKTEDQATSGRKRLTRGEIARVLGRVDDAKAAAIIATGATLEDLEEAAAWAAGESDVLGKVQRHATPVVAAVYDILTVEQRFEDEVD